MKKVSIVGAGIMGSGIAQRFAESGYEVVVVSRREETLKGCQTRIRANQEVLIDAGLLDADAADRARMRIDYSQKLDSIEGSQFVSENVVEILNVKQDLFRKMEDLVDSSAVLSTNTSGLPITEVQSACKFPERVVGMHWWNPPHIIPLVEVTRGEKTSEEVARFTVELSKLLGKKPVMVRKDVPGFIGNRIQAAVVREAMSLVENGVATPEDVDTAVQSGFGFRTPVLGPLRANDFAGLDTALLVFGYLFDEIAGREFEPKRLREMVEAGHLGVKSGKGWYEYTEEFANRAIAERDRQYLRILNEIPGAFEAVKDSDAHRTE